MLVHLKPDTFLITKEPYVTNVSYSISNFTDDGSLGNVTIQQVSFAVQSSSVSMTKIEL